MRWKGQVHTHQGSENNMTFFIVVLLVANMVSSWMWHSCCDPVHRGSAGTLKAFACFTFYTNY